MTQTLCYKCAHEKGYHALTLRQAVIADKCSCGSTKGVLSSDKWRVSPNGKYNKSRFDDD